MGQVWTAVVLGLVGMVFGSGFGLPGAIVGGLGMGAVGWNVAKPKPDPKLPSTTLPVREPIATLGQREAIVSDFLTLALDEALIDQTTHDRLAARVRPETVTVGTPPPAPRPAPERPRMPTRPVAEPPPTPPPRPPTPRPQPAWQVGLTATWNRITSDFAVHGLAYLGVLFVFVATLGFVIFAFSGVGSAYRPIGEAAIPVVLFGGARFLRTRGAPYVSASLELLGGALTPVVIFAAFADNSAFPPDLEDAALVLTLSTLSFALAAAYSLVAIRRPTSMLRFLAAPMVWVGAAVIGLAVESGPSAWQYAAVGLAVVGTVVIARLRPVGVLTRPTLAAAAPGLGAAFALGLLFSTADGWRPGPVIALALAAVVLAELVPERIKVPWLVQGAAVGIAGAVAAVSWDTASVGVAITIVYLALAERWASSDRIAAPVLLVAAVGGVLLSAAEPAALVTAAGIAAAWSHARRLSPWNDDTLAIAGVGAVGFPIAMVWPLTELIGVAETALVGATLAALVVALVRALHPRDPFYGWWGTGLGIVTLIGAAAAYDFGEPAGLLAGVALLASLTVAAGAGPRPGRAWVAGAGLLGTLVLALDALGVATTARPGIVGLVALGTLLAALYWRAEPAGHVAAFAHLVAIGAQAATTTPGARLATLAAFAAGWLAETVADEITGSPLVRLVREATGADTVVRSAAPVIAALSLPFVMADAADQAGYLAEQPGRLGLLLAGLAATYAVVARLVVARRPLAPIMTVAAFVVGLAAIPLAAGDPWPTLGALAAPIAVTVIAGGQLRHPAMVWVSWALGAPIAVLVADRLGLPLTDRRYVLLAWGAVALVGGLIADDVLGGRRLPGEWVRRAAPLKPAVLGAVTVPIALAVIIFFPEPLWWAWVLGAAVLYMGVAVLLRAGGATAVSYTLGALGLFGLASAEGFSPVDHPWLFVAAAAVLTAASAAISLLGDERDPWLGWDAAPLAVAHGLIVTGLADSFLVGGVPTTWTAAGGVLVAIALWKRVPAWGFAGVALAVIGAAVAGSGWLSLALALVAIGATAGAVVTLAPSRTALQWLGAAAGGGSWLAFTDWNSLELATSVPATAVASGVVALVLAVIARTGVLDEDWLPPWAALAAAGMVSAIALAPEAGREPAGWGIAAGLAMWAAATALAARPLRVPPFREAAAVLAMGAGVAAGYAAGTTAEEAVTGAIATSVIAVVVALTLVVARDGSPWIRPLALIAVGSNVAAAIGAADSLPDRTALMLVLAVAGLQAVAAGVTRRTAEFLYVGTGLLLGSWLLFAADALGGNPNWYTVPIGAAIIVVVDLSRWDRRRGNMRTLGTPETLAVDGLGMALLVGASLVQTAFSSPAYGGLAMAFGLGLAAWAAVTRVRRRLYGGGATVVLAGILMLAAPLAEIVPRFRGPALWIAVFAAGTAMILVATFLEQGRARVSAGVRRLEEVLSDWE